MSEFKSFFKSKAMNDAVPCNVEDSTRKPKASVATQHNKYRDIEKRNKYKREYMREYMRRKRTGTGSDCAVDVQQCAGPVPSSNDNVHQSLST